MDKSRWAVFIQLSHSFSWDQGDGGGYTEEKALGIGCVNKAQSGCTTNILSLNGAGRLKSTNGKTYLHHRGPVSPSPSCSAPSGPAEYDQQMVMEQPTEERRAEERRGKERTGDWKHLLRCRSAEGKTMRQHTKKQR